MLLRAFLDNLNGEQLLDRLNLALNGANLGIWDWDLRDNSVQFDQRWCEMLGLQHAETVMELDTWKTRVHPDDLANCYRDIQRHLEGETDYYENIHRMKHVNGNWVYILDRGRISGWDDEGNPIRFTGTHFDCTATERAKRVLEHEQELLQDMIRNLPNAVAMFDNDGCYMAASQQWIADFGLSEQNLTGCRQDEVLGSASYWAELRQRANAGETLSEDEELIECDDGKRRWMRWSVRPWHRADDTIGGVIASYENVTQIVEQRASQENDARLSALGMMAGGIAHEINTPLQTLSLNSGMLADELNQADPDLDFIRECNQSVEETTTRISRVVNGMSTIARDPSKDAPSAVNAHALVIDVSELCASRLRSHGIKFAVDNGIGENTLILACPSEIGQILLNLLNNAHDAVENTEEPWVRLRLEADGNDVLFSVIDSGPGIPTTVAPKIMDPFFTTKPVGKGTGLGLSISRSLSENNGGSLVYRSNLKDTTFELRLPLHCEK